MIREIEGLNKLSKLLLHNRTACVLALCVSLLMMSGSVFALIHRNEAAVDAAYLQAGSQVNVTVSSTGCTPSSSTQTAGQITLKVTNQTGQSELTVQLYGSHGELIREAIITQSGAEWSETFDLKADSYTLVAGRNPNWVCHLTVQ